MTNGSLTIDLGQSLEGSLNYAYRRAVGWGLAYYVARVSVVVLAALTSAKAIGLSSEFEKMQGIFALLVTILTTLDTALKLGGRYRVHYQFDDEYRNLRDELQDVGPPDEEKKRAVIRAKLADIRTRYRKAVFSLAA